MSTPELRPINSSLPRHAPRVLVPSCHRTVGQHPFHVVGQKYIEAVRLAGCLPIVVPSAHPEELLDWLDIADGILLTGSPSNVHPQHFGEAVHDATLPLDPVRDLWTLPLIRHAVKRGLPLLGICRGFQETNVALGGSLYQAVHEQHGLADHRAPDDAQPVNVQYGLAHPIQVHPGGLLSALLETDCLQVNSLHGQGIARLADGLRIEATAPDGLVEAFSVPQSAGFSLCVQWHPEWQANANPISLGILKAFGDACRSWRDLHRPPGP